MWGWATWRRAWAYYDVKMKMWPKFLEQNQIANVFEDRSIQRYWLKCFQAAYEGKIDTWDYQWTYAIWSQNGLTILPNVNLISNIGFGQDAIHTKDSNNPLSNLMRGELLKITHPKDIVRDKLADEHIWDKIFKPVSFYLRAINKIKRVSNDMPTV